jgi:hypothetical protein
VDAEPRICKAGDGSPPISLLETYPRHKATKLPAEYSLLEAGVRTAVPQVD